MGSGRSRAARVVRAAAVAVTLGAAGGCGASASVGTVAGGADGGARSTVDASPGADATEGGRDAGGAIADAAPAADAAAVTAPVDADAPGEVPTDAARIDDGGGARSFTVINRCAQTVWAAALPSTTFPGGAVEMAPGDAFQVGVADGWSGRIWGKVQCTTGSTGKLSCASDPFPSSLAELTLTSSATGLDFYDLSLVDGFNLPIALVAVGHTPDSAHPFDCGSPTCAADLNASCAATFQDRASGAVLACANDACKVLGGNDAGSAACTYPNQYTEFFKTACPQAYSFPSDDPTSTFTCKGFNDYAVVFCP